MNIYIENLQDKIKIDNDLEKLIISVINSTIQNEGLGKKFEVDLTFVDNLKISKINKEHRQKDCETDVLSFPIVDMKNGVIISDEGSIDMDNNNILLGDIIVSLEKAVTQAETYGHTIEREICFLITHGLFHLLGYDHIIKEDEEKMIAKQEEILGKYNLTR